MYQTQARCNFSLPKNVARFSISYIQTTSIHAAANHSPRAQWTREFVASSEPAVITPAYNNSNFALNT